MGGDFGSTKQFADLAIRIPREKGCFGSNKFIFRARNFIVNWQKKWLWGFYRQAT
jgi:hypothetical protein